VANARGDVAFVTFVGSDESASEGDDCDGFDVGDGIGNGGNGDSDERSDLDSDSNDRGDSDSGSGSDEFSECPDCDDRGTACHFAALFDLGSLAGMGGITR
jgi:hypothetical protein